jgi:photosystem II stability/assembly factor-like uncharacterized protein
MLLLPLLLHAQLHSSAGDPIHLPYTCTEDDINVAGMECSESQPCSVYLELGAVSTASGRILVSGNIHSDVATLYSVLLISDDSGATWKEPTPRIQGSALDQLQFLDAQHAWAAGETQYPLARDPFFLITSDGGESWRQRPVSDDGGPGAIQSFNFDSTQHGQLIVDAGKTAESGRYVTYESQTSGDSWMVRSTVDRLPRAKTPSIATMRLQPNKDGKTWQIEKREGTQWTPIASFLIELGTCK